jgi:Ca2+/Na+ antiporter
VSHNELKIKISQKTTDGEQFVPILHKIHNILNQLTIRLWCKDSHREIAGDVTQEDELQVALRFLGSETIIGLIRHMNMIKEHTEEMSKLLLDIICYLVNLDPGFPISFATVIASCLVYIDSHLWPLSVEMIISLLCYYALPMVILYNSCAILDPLSISSTLMIVFDNQNCQPKHHLLLMNMLMKLKLNACTDLLSVVAYGTDTARKNALKLLLHFWPLSFTDYTLNDTFAKLDVPFPECEATSCPNTASYLCLEGSCTTQFGKLHSKDGNKKLYSLMCAECDRVFHRNISDNHKRFKIGQPIRESTTPITVSKLLHLPIVIFMIHALLYNIFD